MEYKIGICLKTPYLGNPLHAYEINGKERNIYYWAYREVLRTPIYSNYRYTRPFAKAGANRAYTELRILKKLQGKDR